MNIAVDFDGTVVSQEGAFDDLATPLRLMPGAKEALESLKRAGHVLILFSARTNRSDLEDPYLDPLVRNGIRRVDRLAWERNRTLLLARVQQMHDFVQRELPGIFDAIDDGLQGKPHAELFIDDRALRYNDHQFSWVHIADNYGDGHD